MSEAACRELSRLMEAAADEAVRSLVASPHDADSPMCVAGRLLDLQERMAAEFPRPADEAAFWVGLWSALERAREQWDRVEAAARRSGAAERLQASLDSGRRALYRQARRHIMEHAPRPPAVAHLELGLPVRRPDRRRLLERIEGLSESVRCLGRLPVVREGITLPPDRANFAIIYGGGWNESAFSILSEAARFQDMNAFVAFDHAGGELFGRAGRHTVRLATSGLLRVGDRDEYVLATFDRPVVLHFVCPHQWSGPPPHEIGVPVLRSDLTLEIVDDKPGTTRALKWYRDRTGADLPLIREEAVRQAPVPADLEALREEALAAIGRLERQSIRELVVKPVRGEQKKGLAYFRLPEGRDAAATHCVRLALESGAVIQERIRPAGPEDFNWRVLVALGPDGEPHVVGRFARVGHAEVTEKARDRDILRACGIVGPAADRFLERLDRVSLNAFRAVAEYAQARHPDFPFRPLGGGSYHVPYILGIDLIGDARVMEVNGNEVAGMWVDDQLYPETRGRSNRTVLESALLAAQAYKSAIQA